ncbi:hypothetical protein GOP47_0002702 [Adiantum capillus-veneris]|uniref:Uncharacterized protein n=1 Tax=Adiantum capillus-veneris TaxID=13818 RepID=A0A9D4ZPE8_ADICA|nr:hypothetical protein GOP47_0002702 [Adiantum capillus-veneris]
MLSCDIGRKFFGGHHLVLSTKVKQRAETQAKKMMDMLDLKVQRVWIRKLGSRPICDHCGFTCRQRWLEHAAGKNQPYNRLEGRAIGIQHVYLVQKSSRSNA